MISIENCLNEIQYISHLIRAEEVGTKSINVAKKFEDLRAFQTDSGLESE